jgi:hypothetical protein
MALVTQWQILLVASSTSINKDILSEIWRRNLHRNDDKFNSLMRFYRWLIHVCCITYKIALKYSKNNLRRPFENCEFTALFYRITLNLLYNKFLLFESSSAWTRRYRSIWTFCSKNNDTNVNSWIKPCFKIISFHIQQQITPNIVVCCYIQWIYSASQASECTRTKANLSTMVNPALVLNCLYSWVAAFKNEFKIYKTSFQHCQKSTWVYCLMVRANVLIVKLYTFMATVYVKYESFVNRTNCIWVYMNMHLSTTCTLVLCANSF